MTYIPKRESALKSALMRMMALELHGFLPLRHEDVRRVGIPDLSVDGLKHTSWLEVKHATPNFESMGYQEYTCNNLATASFCRYLLYWEDGTSKRTIIVHPRHILRTKGVFSRIPEIECFTMGHNHRWVCHYLIHIHTHHGR